MSDAFPLPLECLQLVITNLATVRDLKTLAILLRVSKHVCLATLPTLYKDPFVWFMPEYGQQYALTLRSYESVIPVIRLLFAHVPKESYSGLLKAMYGIGDESPEVVAGTSKEPPMADDSSASTSQYWPINYLSYVCYFNSQDHMSTSVLAVLEPFIALNPQLQSYVDEHKLAKVYAASALDLCQHRSRRVKEDSNTFDYLKLNINREATWALCSPILEQLQSIVIPVSDIGRYANSMTRLSSLATITFRLDELADISEYTLEQMDTEEMRKIGPLQKKRQQDLKAAVEFVRTHTAMFRGTLKQVLFPSISSSWNSNRQSCPDAILGQILELLPALIEPTELANRNWEQFVAKAERTNLDHVTKIDIGRKFAEESYFQLKSKPFLHRCLSLRKYNMISLGPDSFKWVVRGLSGDQHDGQAGPAANVPPLEDINIHVSKERFGSELDDIGQGFGATLKSFTILGYLEQIQQTEGQSLTVGRGWRMPVLSMLSVNFLSEKMVLDPDFLCYCPLLKTLSLSDCRATYNLNEIKVTHPAYLPELTNLVLSSSAALAFHPDTLHSAKELRRLTLGSERSYRITVIPSIEDIIRDDHQSEDATENPSTIALSIHRPKWTWDWYLPSLSTLNLTVEFAFHFQFRMLQGTPNLRELYLNMYSCVHPLERVLTNNDFTVSRLQDHHQEEGVDNGNDNGLASSKDLTDKIDLHSQSTKVLKKIHSYLVTVDVERQRGFRQMLTATWSEEQLSAERLLRIREGHMSAAFVWGIPNPECPNHPDGNCFGDNGLKCVLEIVQAIEKLAHQSGLQPELDAVLAELRVLQTRERQENEDLKNYRVEHPNHLVVPSVKKLELYGRWIMSGEVLETILGRVFRNVIHLNECLTAGYSLDTLISVTQSMPWLETVCVANPFDPASLSDKHKLQSRLWGSNPPFMNDARTRVLYRFVGSQDFTLACNDGSDSPEERVVVE